MGGAGWRTRPASPSPSSALPLFKGNLLVEQARLVRYEQKATSFSHECPLETCYHDSFLILDDTQLSQSQVTNRVK